MQFFVTEGELGVFLLCHLKLHLTAISCNALVPAGNALTSDTKRPQNTYSRGPFNLQAHSHTHLGRHSTLHYRLNALNSP